MELKTGKKYKKIKEINKKVNLGAPEFIEMTCKSCGAALSIVDEKHAKCEFCKKTYMIDEPEDINISVYVNGDRPIPDAPIKMSKSAAILSIVFTVIVFAGIILLAVVDAIGNNLNKPEPLQNYFYQEVFGKKPDKVTKEEFEKVRFFRFFYDGARRETQIDYSFADYREMSEEEFQQTIKTFITKKKYSDKVDFSALTGIIRVDASAGYTKGLTYLSKNLKLIYLDSAKKLEELGNLIEPDLLEVLHLFGQQKEISGIERYQNLKELSIGGGGSDYATDLKGIAKLKKLQVLNLGRAKNYLSVNELFELSELKEFSASGLSLRVCADGLPKLSKLQKLCIDVEDEDDLSPIGALKELTFLEFGGNGEISPEGLQGLTKLTHLDCCIGTIEAYQSLSLLPSLEELRLFVCFIEFDNRDRIDCNVLLNMPKLRTFSIRTFFSNNLINGEALLNLPELSSVTITSATSRNQCLFVHPELVNPGEKLTDLNLRYVSFGDQEKKEKMDYSMIEKFSNLETLNLNDCELKDISFLKELTKLKICMLERNEIVDYSPLLSSPGLEKLYIFGNTGLDTSLPATCEVILNETFRN